MNRYAVCIRWDDGLSMSVIETSDACTALGLAIVQGRVIAFGAPRRRMPIQDYSVQNIDNPTDKLEP